MGSVTTHIVRIGNSQGIRIPKALIEQCHLQGALELEPRGDYLIVRSASKSRASWDEAFQAMAERGDDQLLEGNNVPENTWDKDEWEWS